MALPAAPVISTTVGPAVSRAGIACLIAGLLGAGSGLFLLAVEPQVPATRFSFPLSAGGFVALQLWFVVQHLGLLAGQAGLWASGAAGRSRVTTGGHLVALAGMALLTLTELVAVSAAEDPYPSPTTDVLDVMYGVSTIATGIGLVGVGLGMLRHGSWIGWRRWLPVALGVWVFVPMTPAIVAGFVPARLGITGWMLLYAALGWALAVPRLRPAEETTEP